MVDAIRVLYVDDELGLLEIAKLYLKESGEFSVTTIDSAISASDLLEKEKFDAIISDYQIPGMDGIEFLIEVRTRFGKIPFILFTGKGREEVVIQSINNGADFYLQKGGDPGSQFAELSHKIKQAASRKLTEMALLKSEGLLQTIVTNLNGVIFFVDKEGIFLLSEGKSLSLLGLQSGQVVEESVFDVYKDVSEIIVGMRAALSGKLWSGISHVQDIFFDTIVTPIFDSLGMVSGAMGIAVDITGEKRTEEAFITSEAQISAFLNGITTNIAFVDKDLKILWANKIAAESVNKSPAEMIGHTCHALWGDPARPCENCPTLKVFETKQSEYTIMHTPDGRVWDERGESVFDEKGNLIGVVEIAQDITEWKRAEDELRESERKYRDLFECSCDAIMILEPPSWKFTSCNQAALDLFGAKNEAVLISLKPWDLSPDCQSEGRNSRKKANDMIKNAIQNRSSFFEWMHKRIDGIEFPSTVLLTRVDYKGTVFLQTTVRNITDQKRAEEALAKSEEKFRGIFDTINDGIHIHEIEQDGKPGKFLEVNEVACQMLQYTREELLEHGPLDFVTDYHNRPLNDILQDLSSTGHSVFETEHRRRDATIVPVEINSNLVSLMGEQLVVSVVRHITERKQAEEALRLANKKLNLLSGITRHDKKNKILIIQGFLQFA